MQHPIAFIVLLTMKDNGLNPDGLKYDELDRDLSLCGHAINDPSNVVKIVILEMMRGFDNPTSSVTGSKCGFTQVPP
jgi:hypothetical protein